MSLIIPDDILDRAGMSEEELRLEVALLLFRMERLTLAQACRLSGLTRLEFQRVLADRRIPIRYGPDDLRSDLENLREVGPL